MSSSSTSSPTDQFGPNEWLVEEMYQRFLEDPDSVDPAWHEFFADYRPGDASPTSGSAAQTAADTTAAPSPLQPIAKPGRQAPRSEPCTRRGARARASAAHRHPQGHRQARRGQHVAGRRPPGRERRPGAEGVTTTLRGAAPRSPRTWTPRSTVPTATSVRAVPAKLMADNRVVINNHLRPHPRRQDQLHPPDRLRPGQGAAPITRR